jgi:glycopeptide antibiotics resistance protein
MYNIDLELIKSLIICNFIALITGSFIIIFSNQSRNKKIQMPISNTMLFIMLCYFASLAAITIVPLPFSYTGKFVRSNVNLVPLVNTVENLVSPLKKRSSLLAKDVLENIIGNILMFLPLGFLLPLANEKLASYKKIFLIAFGCSVSIELTQLISRLIHNYRQIDIDDVILNTLGAIAGFYIYERWLANKTTSSLDNVTEQH